MTRLEYAQRLYGYDPETTPLRELERAKQSVSEAEIRRTSDREALNELDDNAVYEWSFYTEHNIHVARKREIVKRTSIQIRLASKHRGERQTYLPRPQLEAGELVRHGKGWGGTDYVFGWVIRPKLKEQLAKSVRWLESSRNELQRIELAIINDELLVTADQRQMIEMVMGLAAKSNQSDTPKINWRQEGF